MFKRLTSLFCFYLMTTARGLEEDSSPDNGTTEDNGDSGGGSSEVKGIIGFAVVLSLLLLALCIVTLLCFRYGTCKCLNKKRSQKRDDRQKSNRSFIPGLHQNQSGRQTSVKAQANGDKALQGVINPRFALSRDASTRHPPPAMDEAHASQPRTPNAVVHSQGHYRTHHLPSPLMRPTNDCYPPCTELGYPYDPHKSPKAKLHYNLPPGLMRGATSDHSISKISCGRPETVPYVVVGSPEIMRDIHEQQDVAVHHIHTEV